jgi:putative tryptophan/tyrosine transport system substrate-binding protein
VARPNGNTTGISVLQGDLNGKRQDFLIEELPGLRRMAALADPNMSTEEKLDALQQAARAQYRAFYISRRDT